MSVEKREATVESRLQTLDEELRRAKASLDKVEHELGQALNQIWGLDSGLRKLEENVGDAAGIADSIPGLQEDIRQLRGQVDRLQERQAALVGRAEDMGRQQQSDLERERQERATLLKQAEAAARSVGQFESRIQLLEDSLRRVEESVAEARLSHQTLARDVEELTNRGNRNLETALRLEHLIESLGEEIEALHKRDGELEEKVTLHEERVRRGEEKINKFETHLSLTLEIKEQLDRARFERQQISERLGKLESSAGELAERTAEFTQGLARIDQRTQGQGSRLLEIADDLKQQREEVGDQLQRLIRTMERQRRRQAEALAQEIKELKRSELNHEQ